MKRIAILLNYAALMAVTLLFANPASAQMKPVVAIVELDVHNPEAFAREFFPIVSKVFADADGTFLARPSQPTAVGDVAPKRVAVIRFESAQQALDTFVSKAYRDARKIGDQYASFRIFIVEPSSP